MSSSRVGGSRCKNVLAALSSMGLVSPPLEEGKGAYDLDVMTCVHGRALVWHLLVRALCVPCVHSCR